MLTLPSRDLGLTQVELIMIITIIIFMLLWVNLG
jgi:hypothetical protein